MMKFATAIAAFCVALSATVASAQTSPGLYNGLLPTAAQWNGYFSSKLDYNPAGCPIASGCTGANTAAGALTALGALPGAGGSMTGKLNLFASGAGGAGVNCGVGTTPPSPVNGDVWCTASGMFARIAGSTAGPFGAAGGTVTSVALDDLSTVPIFGITGSPVTGGGTLNITLGTQTANKVFAGPTSGGAAQPMFRSLVATDFTANVAALSGLTGSANVVPYFTGAGAMATNPYTAFARAFDAVSTYTANGVLVGNGASAPQVTTAGSAGQVLTSNGSSTKPTFQNSQSTWRLIQSTVISSPVGTVSLSIPASIEEVYVDVANILSDVTGNAQSSNVTLSDGTTTVSLNATTGCALTMSNSVAKNNFCDVMNLAATNIQVTGAPGPSAPTVLTIGTPGALASTAIYAPAPLSTVAIVIALGNYVSGTVTFWGR